MNTHELFIVLNYVSIFIMFACCVVICTHSGSKMQQLALLVCISLAVCCIGFLFRAEAVDAKTYILGQKLIYAFVTHGMFLMLLFIMEYCRFKAPKIITRLFAALNFIITFVVLTLDYHSMFYKSYWAVIENGNCVLEKEYGFMHTVTVALFGIYMLAAVVIAIAFSVKNIKTRSKYAWRLLVAVSLPCLSYIIPKLTGMHNDLQPTAFAAFAVLVLYMIYKNNLYDVANIAAKYSIDAVDQAIVVFDNDYQFKGCNKSAFNLFPVLNNLNLDNDVRTVMPEMGDYINGYCQEYRSGNKIFNISVHSIDESLSAPGKVVRFEDITLQRNYTDLLEAHKTHLESEVETLTNYSYTDYLTGLKNRRSFQEYVDDLNEKGDVSSIFVASVDLNGLKEINDNFSHAAGDESIVAVSTTLTSAFSDIGELFRTGGDEFYVIFEKEPSDLAARTDKLIEDIKNWRGSIARSVSISYGFAFGKDGNSTSLIQLLIEADKNMYKNKKKYYETSGNDRRHR